MKSFYTTYIICILTLLCYGCNKEKESITKNYSSVKKNVKKNVEKKLNGKFIKLIDTVIDNKKLKVDWNNNGYMVAKFDLSTDSLKWFRFDEDAINRENSAIIIKSKKKATNYIINDSIILFSIVDFKNRAALFNIHIENNKIKFSSTISCLNPVIKECRYIYVDLEKNLIVNNSGSKPVDYEKADKYIVDIYEYKIQNNCLNKKRTYQIENDQARFFDNQSTYDFYRKNY